MQFMYTFHGGKCPGGNCQWGEVTGGKLSGREMSMGGSARGGKRRGKLPGGEVSGHLINTTDKSYFSVILRSQGSFSDQWFSKYGF